MKSLLIDGNSLINRAFYALPVLSTDEGLYTNAVYGFLKMFFKAVDEYKPDTVVCAFDVKHPTFRHEKYADYKAGRKKMPEELVPQIPLLKDVLTRLGVCCCEKPGFEADDIIGTYARMTDLSGGEAAVLTGDRDSFQLISEHTSVWYTKKGISDVLVLTPDNLKEHYGVLPGQVCDLKALMGDASDNIPGVPGIGEKTAQALIETYGSLDGLYRHIDELKGKQKEKLEAGKQSAYDSLFLVTIVRDVPLPPLEECAYKPVSDEEAGKIFRQYQFKSLYDRVGTAREAFSCKTEEFKDFVFSGDRLALWWDESSFYVAVDENTQYRAPLTVDLFTVGYGDEELTESLRPLMEDESIQKYCFDTKAALHRWPGAKGLTGDVMLAAYLLAAGGDEPTFASVASFYEAEPGACALLYIFQKQQKALESKNLLHLYNEVELPLARVLFEMEQTGFHVDETVLRRLSASFRDKISALTAEIYALADKEFNINSPKQLGEVLFEDRKLPTGKKTKSGYSTDNEVLEALEDKDPIVPCVIEYRQLQKLKGTYLDGMAPLIREGRIHTTFRQAVASTGRLSSTEPNLQNIPVRSEAGKEIRKAFTAQREGWCLVNADYSQIELRLLAHLSGDKTMIRSFADGEDIHARTAAEVFGIPLNEVTPAQRSRAKAVNFGIVYGISDFGLAKSIHSTKKEAADFIAAYFARYPDVEAYLKESVAAAKRCGHAETILGRRREIPQLRDQNFNRRSFGERVAMNAPIQGSAADIIKLAMLQVAERLRKEPHLGALILQVHDELILETEQTHAAAAAQMLRETMEQVVTLRVPLVAETHIAQTWFELK